MGAVLLLSGTEEALRRFRPTLMTVMVDSFAEWQHALAALGASIVEPPTLVEYVEHHA